MNAILPPADSEFGSKVRTRLERESVIWLSTVNSRGIPQPNPVWFVWEHATILTYNLPNSARVRNVHTRPEVSAHFNQLDGADDIVVLVGTARVATHAPAADAHAGYLAKYTDLIPLLGHDTASFAATYSVPIAMDVSKVRGE